VIIDLNDAPERHVPYDRCIEWRWKVADFDVVDHGRAAVLTYRIVLRCSHYGKADWAGQPDKCYTASLVFDNEKVSEGWRSTEIHLGGREGMRSLGVHKVPVARYSAKTFESFAADALDLLRQHDDERVSQMIALADDMRPVVEDVA